MNTAANDYFLLLIILPVIFLIHSFITWSLKCQKIGWGIKESNVNFYNVLFCVTNSSQPK